MPKQRFSVSKKKETYNIKKEFFQRLLYIGLCIIPIIIFGEEEGTFRLVPLPFFLIGIYNLLLIISLSQAIIDEFFPPKTAFEKTTKPFDKFVYYFSNILFFVSLVFMIFEGKKIGNTINGSHLFWISGFIGIALALLITIILKLTNPSVYFVSERRYVVHFGIFMGLFLLTAASTSFINHFATNNETCAEHTVLRKGTGGTRYKEHFIYINTESNNEERFSIKKALYNELSEGGKIELCIVKGKLGYYFVTKFNKSKQ